jgi:hypothetical protein
LRLRSPRDTPLPLLTNVLLLRWDTKPAAHQEDVPSSCIDTQNVLLRRRHVHCRAESNTARRAHTCLVHVEWVPVGIVAALLIVVVVGCVRLADPQDPLLARREWTEDCRVFQHRHCRHIGSARTYGLGGVKEFVTICGCPCHWGCPSEEVSLPEMSSECICPENGEVRQENFERFAKRSALHRVLSHWR